MSKMPNLHNFETDVVVIGGGLAGYAAALEAVQQGAEVMLLEKQAECGGSSVLSGGFFAFAGTDIQPAASINDSNDLLYEDIRRAGQQQNDEALVCTYVEHQMAAYQWVQRQGGKFTYFVRNGTDEDFGRTGLSSGYGNRVELKRGPWYAYPSTSGLIATYCGVTIDTETRVLDVFGTPIAGLYAAGEMTGAFTVLPT